MARSKNKLVYNVGVNDVTYKVQRYEKIKDKWVLVWVCPYYLKWKSLLQRCYSEKEQRKNPRYVGCTVCDEWKKLSNFIKWVDSQPNRDWESCELDKDILKVGNKYYSPENCVFVTHDINCFIVDCGAVRGRFSIGVDFVKASGKFRARCKNPFGKTSAERAGHLGYFNTEHEAHLTWKERKHEIACYLAKTQKDLRVAEALVKRYSEGTDWTNI